MADPLRELYEAGRANKLPSLARRVADTNRFGAAREVIQREGPSKYVASPDPDLRQAALAASENIYDPTPALASLVSDVQGVTGAVGGMGKAMAAVGMMDNLRPPSELPGTPKADEAGLVPSRANAIRLLAQMKPLIEEYTSKGMPLPAAEALAYTKTKYPLYSNQATIVAANPQPQKLSFLKPTDRGAYNEFRNRVIFNRNRSTPDTINTLAHELTHARQMRKDPKAFENYISPEEGLSAYANQPVERFARQAGSTAEDTYTRFGEFFDEARRGERLEKALSVGAGGSMYPHLFGGIF